MRRNVLTSLSAKPKREAHRGWCPTSVVGNPPIIPLTMLAQITAFLFSSIALALSVWLYFVSVGNQSVVIRTQKLEAKAESLQGQLATTKKSLEEQQEKIAALPVSAKGRPPVVSDTVTLADWNNNPKLKELLVKYGYAGANAKAR
jgi:hypothetical protein